MKEERAPGREANVKPPTSVESWCQPRSPVRTTISDLESSGQREELLLLAALY